MYIHVNSKISGIERTEQRAICKGFDSLKIRNGEKTENDIAYSNRLQHWTDLTCVRFRAAFQLSYRCEAWRSPGHAGVFIASTELAVFELRSWHAGIGEGFRQTINTRTGIRIRDQTRTVRTCRNLRTSRQEKVTFA